MIGWSINEEALISKKAFTLIELLVVIAIIAILAAILFPVFAQAKVAAQKTTSLSNIKQQAMGVIMYAGDYDDTNTFSEYGGGNSGTDQAQWYATVYPYIKSGQKYTTANGNMQAWGNDGLWKDPMFPDQRQGQQYGINSDIAPGNYDGGTKRPVNNSIIDEPADKVLIMNKCKNGTYWNYPYLSAEEWYWTPWVGSIANGVPYRDGSEIASGQLPRDHGGYLNRDARDDDPNRTGWCVTDWKECELGLAPRFRYNGVAVAAFADGHARTVRRGELKWYKNVAVRNGNWPWTESWYPY